MPRPPNPPPLPRFFLFWICACLNPVHVTWNQLSNNNEFLHRTVDYTSFLTLSCPIYLSVRLSLEKKNIIGKYNLLHVGQLMRHLLFVLVPTRHCVTKLP